ncbi:hypothetical protein WJR50_19885 [Catalinimonas sp. 4WD22]|uniref:hypothetical protein n=1 Tax=Catalinimonas locisalis TaxID=3133978 RepID=UPI0031015458
MKNIILIKILILICSCQNSKNIALKEYSYDWNDGEYIKNYTSLRLKKEKDADDYYSFTYFYDTTYKYSSNEFITDHDGYYVTFKKVSGAIGKNYSSLIAIYGDKRPSDYFSIVDSSNYKIDSVNYKIIKYKREDPPDDGDLELYWNNEFGLIQSYSVDWGIKMIYGGYDNMKWKIKIDKLNQRILEDKELLNKN